MSSTHSFKKWRLVGIAVTVLVLAGVSGIFLQKWVVIRVITCSTAAGSCPDSLNLTLTTLMNQPLLFKDTTEQVREVIRANQQPYQLVSLKKRFPGTLAIVVVEDQLQYQLKLPTGEVFGVSHQGWLKPLPESQAQLLTFEMMPDSLNLDLSARQLPVTVHDELNQYRALLAQNGVEVHAVILIDRVTSVLKLSGDRQAVIARQDKAENIARLAQILKASPELPTGQTVQEIDVRFKLPVLRTQKTY
jgi:cell division septal protein FtsQ